MSAVRFLPGPLRPVWILPVRKHTALIIKKLPEINFREFSIVDFSPTSSIPSLRSVSGSHGFGPYQASRTHLLKSSITAGQGISPYPEVACLFYHKELTSQALCSTYIMPGIPPPMPPGIPPGIPAPAPSFSGLSVISASVVSINEATLEAF